MLCLQEKPLTQRGCVFIFLAAPADTISFSYVFCLPSWEICVLVESADATFFSCVSLIQKERK